MAKIIEILEAGSNIKTFQQFYYAVDGDATTEWGVLTAAPYTMSNGKKVQYARRFANARTETINGVAMYYHGDTPEATFGALPGTGIGTPDTTTTVTLVNGANANVAVTADFMRITGPSAGFSINGFQAGVDGQELEIYNTTAQALTITNDATSSTANRIITTTGADLTNVKTLKLKYSSVDQRWIVIN